MLELASSLSQICLSTKDASRSSSILQETTECLAKHFSLAHEQLAQLTYQLLSRIIDCCVQEDENAAKVEYGRWITIVHESIIAESAGSAAPLAARAIRARLEVFLKFKPIFETVNWCFT